MSKFKIRFKLQGLEVDVEGSREDLPHLANALGNQLVGALSPALDMASGANSEMKDITPSERLSAVIPPKKARKKRASSTNSSADEASAIAVDWLHDPAKWGTPSQAWNTADKGIWLIYVVSKETGLTELTQSQITATFNKHFKQSGLLKPSNVSRDLGKRKIGKDASVGENTTKNPSSWFLTESGIKYAVGLVSQQIGTS